MAHQSRHHRLRAAHLPSRPQTSPSGHLHRQPALPDQRGRFIAQEIPPRCRCSKARHPSDDSPRQRLSRDFLLHCTRPQAQHVSLSSTAAPGDSPVTFLFPPLLRQEILQAAPSEGDHVLVYVTSPAPALAKLLSAVRCRFVAYGFGREGNEGNILYKKPSLDGFFSDLNSARAVIANSGFSLVTEALHLGKPYLAVPVSHQFEQIFNAYWLEKSGYGAYWEDLNKERVDSFLYNLPHYREALAQYPRQGNGALLEKLDALIAGYSAR